MVMKDSERCNDFEISHLLADEDMRFILWICVLPG